MQTSQQKRGVIVGLFIFIGIAFLMTGILMVGNLRSTFTTKIELQAIFDDVNGLQAGSNIWFSGVKVGIVKSLDLYEGSQVLVVLKINEGAQKFIHKDSKVKVSTDGLIGNKIVIIVGGTAEAGQVKDGDWLAIEGQTSTEEMLSMLQENNRNLLAITTDFKAVSQRLANGEGTIGKLLKDEGLYNQLEATSASLQRTAGHAEQVGVAAAAYSAKLNRKGTLANELVTDTVVFNKVKASVAQLELMATQASEAAGNLKMATANLSVVTAKLDDPNTPVGVLLSDTKTAEHLKGTLKNLESGSAKLDENLRALQDNFLLRRYFKKKKKTEAAGKN